MRICRECETVLSSNNPGKLCYACQEKHLGNLDASDSYYDAQDLADILGLQSAESVKRLAQKDLLPQRIPAIRKYLWPKEVIDCWIRSEHRITATNEKEQWAVTTCMKLGWPVAEITSYGHDMQNLYDYLEELGHHYESSPKDKRRN